MQRLLQHMQAKDQPQHSVQVIWNTALLHTCISGNKMLQNFTKDYDFKDSDFAVRIYTTCAIYFNFDLHKSQVACKLLRKFSFAEQIDLLRREYLEWIVECAYLCHTKDEVDCRIIDNMSNEIIWEHAFSALAGEK